MAGDRMNGLTVEVRVVGHLVCGWGDIGEEGITVRLQDTRTADEFEVWCKQDEAPPIGSRHTLQAIAA